MAPRGSQDRRQALNMATFDFTIAKANVDRALDPADGWLSDLQLTKPRRSMKRLSGMMAALSGKPRISRCVASGLSGALPQLPFSKRPDAALGRRRQDADRQRQPQLSRPFDHRMRAGRQHVNITALRHAGCALSQSQHIGQRQATAFEQAMRSRQLGDNRRSAANSQLDRREAPLGTPLWTPTCRR
jgi:hypothetical protein